MSFIRKINIVTTLFLLLGSMQLIGQSGTNPFELKHRLDKKANVVEPSSSSNVVVNELDDGIQNPFNIIRSPNKNIPDVVLSSKESIPTEESTITALADDKNFRFSLTLVMLISLAMSLSIYRAQIKKAYHAFTNENVMQMLHREKGTVAYVPYYILYGLFLFNLGIFIYLLFRFYELTPDTSSFDLLTMSVGTVSVLVFLKHLALKILGWVFPIQKEISIYSLTITVFGIILSIILFVANVIIAYAPPQIIPIAINLSLIIIGIVYFFRSIRGLFLASKFLNRNKFHFFIYLCGVEIAPVLILLKIAMSGTGIQ
ncbi:MAG: DUF4271 domain-containing protein [Saprospiraceae bacterium]|jgi:hypothetical protein|nr:DUF4271 domain-containing protein [Saprospiraceae bacterium]MDG1432481.1 DUF4271 domain-containing protein [Saprospiraceae bacterium]MDG2417371.1 DUF4271 domain-containing protein [Saprospiraceae bacterium]